MSLHRLTFLYPHLWKNARVQAPGLPTGPLCLKRKRPSRSKFSTASQHREDTFPQRYGTAAEPLPISTPTSDQPERTKTLADAIEKEVKSPGAPKQEKRSSPSQAKDESTTTSESSVKIASEPTKSSTDDAAAAAANGSSPQPTPSAVSRETMIKPMDRLSQLEVSAPSEDADHKPPHLQAPPYLHHFDTYTIVRDLQKGGFTHDQSVTLTKAVRSLLAVNLDIARQGLVSKSDVENV